MSLSLNHKYSARVFCSMNLLCDTVMQLPVLSGLCLFGYAQRDSFCLCCVHLTSNLSPVNSVINSAWLLCVQQVICLVLVFIAWLTQIVFRVDSVFWHSTCVQRDQFWLPLVCSSSRLSFGCYWTRLTSCLWCVHRVLFVFDEINYGCLWCFHREDSFVCV